MDQPERTPIYELTAGERAVIQQFDAVLKAQKARVHDLQAELDAARAAVKDAQQAFSGAVTFLANTHGMQNAVLTPDFKIKPQIGAIQ